MPVFVSDPNTFIDSTLMETIGCREGETCPFSHDASQITVAVSKPLADGESAIASQAVTESTQTRVVSRPTPKAQVEDPREYQLGQIRRRYKPKETQGPGGATILHMQITPSDPDFPFELSALECALAIPANYPAQRPTINVKNTDIPRGFAINIERGFHDLAESKKGFTLLALVAALDKHLEEFLSWEKKETVKLVANADIRHISTQPTVVLGTNTHGSATSSHPQPSTDIRATPKPEQVFTAAEKSQARDRREVETRQLEARLGRLPLFKKSGDGIAYTVPVEPRRRADLPVTLQAVKTVKIFVPLMYPLQPCRLQIEGVDSEEAKPAELAFGKRSQESKETNLMGHINYFAQNMHTMAKFVVQPEPAIIPIVAEPAAPKSSQLAGESSHPEDDRSHIRHIPRPPEWDIVSGDETDSDDYTYDSGDEDSETGGIELSSDDQAQPTAAPAQLTEHGTALSFPFIELYNIELLTLTTLNLSIKCSRCKEPSEFTSIKPNATKTQTCRKCATLLSISFRSELIHAHALRAGFLDLSGCTPLDMLPSSFTPTCSNCSTAYPAPGVNAVRGDTTSNVCRECHQKFTFKIAEVKFLRISNEHVPSASGPRRKKETLGLVAGTELPRRGRCKHYSKSLRWFRFSCCQKVYACDRCHDEGEEHANEHANRMICGFCSREQNYRPEDCGICHGVLVGKKGGGFWEGGKGTRDRVRMSRKDKRKFRRKPREGGKVVGSAAAK